jgi:transposase-like protein
MSCCRFRGHEDKIMTKESEMRRKFPKEFKFEVLKLMTDRDGSMAQAARDLNLAESVLRRWMQSDVWCGS